MYLQDLTFIDDGNNDFLDAEKKLINFDKRFRLSNVILVIIRLQQDPYKLTPLYDVINELVTVKGFGVDIHDEIAYRFSKYIENVSGTISHDDISDFELTCEFPVYSPKIVLQTSNIKKSNLSSANFAAYVTGSPSHVSSPLRTE